MKTLQTILAIVGTILVFFLNSPLLNAQRKAWKDRIVEDSIPQYVLPSTYLYGMYEWMIGDACSDAAEVGGYWPEDSPDGQQMSIFNINAGQFPIFTYYRWNYFGIKLCNQFLKMVGTESLPPSTQYQKAEILFYRALFYYNLVRLFGDVPIYTENDISQFDTLGTEEIYQQFMPVIQSDSIHKPRSAASEVWQMIGNDLTVAIPNLPQKSAFDGDLWNHVTKGAALTLMAKVNLYQKNWSGVLIYTDELINSGEYALEDNFLDCFGIEKHGVESIFELEQYPITAYPGLPDANGPYWLSFNHNVLYNPRHVYQDWPGVSSDYIITNYGWGFNCPKQNYVESFIPGDPRKKATIIDQGDSILSQITASGMVWDIMDPLNEIDTTLFNDLGSPTGYYSRKYYISYQESCDAGACSFGTPHTGGYKNIRVFRYADVLLMAAEAHYQLGDENSARNYVNMIRTRARISGNTGKPEDLTSITLDSIYNERKWEFGGEGCRLFDLLRTGKAYQAINGTYNSTLDTTATFDSVKHSFFPIPVQELAISGGIMTQNPGYETANMIKDITRIKPIEDIVISIDTAIISTRESNYLVQSGDYDIHAYFDLDSFLQVASAPVFALKSKSSSGTVHLGLNNPDINGDQPIDQYHFDFQYELYNYNSPTGEGLNLHFPFTDTLIFSVYNYVKYVSDTFTFTIEPKAPSSIEPPNTVSEISIIPNPADDYIIIQLWDNPVTLADIEIYSITGTLAYHGKLNSKNTSIDISMFEQGVYFIKITALNWIEKIIINH